MFRPEMTVVVERALNINNDSCSADPEVRPGMSDASPALFGISGPSFDSTLLTGLSFFCLLPVLFLSSLFCVLAHSPKKKKKKSKTFFNIFRSNIGFLVWLLFIS